MDTEQTILAISFAGFAYGLGMVVAEVFTANLADLGVIIAGVCLVTFWAAYLYFNHAGTADEAGDDQ